MRKRSVGGFRSLAASNCDDLGRPQVLRLEIDQLAGRADRPNICLEYPKRSVLQTRIAPFRHGADQLHGGRSTLRRRRRDRQPLRVTPCQRRAKCASTSDTTGPSTTNAASCQPTAARGDAAGSPVGHHPGRSDRYLPRRRPDRRPRSSFRDGSGAVALAGQARSARPHGPARRAPRVPSAAKGETTAQAHRPTAVPAHRPAAPHPPADLAPRPDGTHRPSRIPATKTSH